jgi:anti-sigma factor RsiW
MTDRTHDCPHGWDSGQLLAYLEGDLEAEDRRGLELHLNRCEACSREMEALQQVHSLLLEHPLAFHPSEQDLFLLAKYGEDPGGSLSEHLKSCPDCARDLEVLREMESVGHAWSEEVDHIPVALLNRLEKLHSTEGVKPPVEATWISEALEWLKGPFRLPVFGLATAVAAVVVIVLAVPMSRVLDEERLPTIGSTKEKIAEPVVAPKPAVPPADQIAEDRLDERSKSQPKLEREVRPRKQNVVPATLPKERKGKSVPSRYGKWSHESSTLRSTGPNKVQTIAPKKTQTIGDPSSRFHGDQYVERPYSGTHGYGSVAPYPPQGTPGRVRLPDSVPKKDKKRLLGDKPPGRSPAILTPTAGTRTPAEAARRRVRSEFGRQPVGVVSSAGSKTVVKLSIVDQNGRDIPWLAFSPPPGLSNRFRFIRETGQQKADASIPTKIGLEKKEAEFAAKLNIKDAFTISIQVSRSGATFDLRASLTEPRTHRHIRTIEALNVSRKDLIDRIRSLVSYILETR